MVSTWRCSVFLVVCCLSVYLVASDRMTRRRRALVGEEALIQLLEGQYATQIGQYCNNYVVASWGYNTDVANQTKAEELYFRLKTEMKRSVGKGSEVGWGDNFSSRVSLVGDNRYIILFHLPVGQVVSTATDVPRCGNMKKRTPWRLLVILACCKGTLVGSERRLLTDEELLTVYLTTEYAEGQMSHCHLLDVAEWEYETDVANLRKADELNTKLLDYSSFKKDQWELHFKSLVSNWSEADDPNLRRQLKFLTVLGTSALNESLLTEILFSEFKESGVTVARLDPRVERRRLSRFLKGTDKCQVRGLVPDSSSEKPHRLRLHGRDWKADQGGEPAFAWRESGKPFREPPPPPLSSPNRDSNLDLPVLRSLALHETSAFANYATEAELLLHSSQRLHKLISQGFNSRSHNNKHVRDQTLYVWPIDSLLGIGPYWFCGIDPILQSDIGNIAVATRSTPHSKTAEQYSQRFVRAVEVGVLFRMPEATRVKSTLNSCQTRMENVYSTAKICPYRDQGCNLTANGLSLDPGIESVISSSRDYDELTYAWKSWRDATGPKMREDYKKYVEINNIAAAENGFSDNGEMWRSSFESETFIADMDALWDQVRPLYDELHKYVRSKLRGVYGDKMDDSDGLLPAHILDVILLSWPKAEFVMV
uniref:Angiotensin-converting enzyme n=1 Tax=Timema bartmani TaxID=61472 RepID=A0A7R9EPM6_9NEOP|nr:unnamed protein product [Timema bartmani]